MVESPAGWFVSLSRVGSLVAVAVTDVAAVGLDIESVASVARAPVADVLLHPSETASSHGKLARLWCAKEAVLKAAGVGLRVSPSLLAFAGATLASWPSELGFDEAPGVEWFALDDDVVGAVAVVGVGSVTVAVATAD